MNGHPSMNRTFLLKVDAEGWTLINYPPDKPYRKREARWVQLD